MGWTVWRQRGKKLLRSAAVTEPFHLLTATLLSLLLPLSFLLLARLSAARYLLSFAPSPPQDPSSRVLRLFLHANPILLHALVSIIAGAGLIHGLTGRIKPTGGSPDPIIRPHLCAAWILLCTLQVCVGLGIEGNAAAGIDGSGFGQKRSLLGRVVFFVGLHETMLYWWRTVVKPVVDDTVVGYAKEEKWVERAAMAAGFGTLWWWRLRDEVESLPAMVEMKKEAAMGIGAADFVGWWLYYLTVTIGMVRIVKGVMWMGVVLLCRRLQTHSDVNRDDEEDKV